MSTRFKLNQAILELPSLTFQKNFGITALTSSPLTLLFVFYPLSIHVSGKFVCFRLTKLEFVLFCGLHWEQKGIANSIKATYSVGRILISNSEFFCIRNMFICLHYVLQIFWMLDLSIIKINDYAIVFKNYKSDTTDSFWKCYVLDSQKAIDSA